MDKRNKALFAISAAVLAVCIYRNGKKREKPEDKEWSPVDIHEVHREEAELLQPQCTIDYVCVFQDADDLVCALINTLHEFYGVRCDQIIRIHTEDVDGTVTLFATTASARYIVYYNPETGKLQTTKLVKK